MRTESDRRARAAATEWDRRTACHGTESRLEAGRIRCPNLSSGSRRKAYGRTRHQDRNGRSRGTEQSVEGHGLKCSHRRKTFSRGQRQGRFDEKLPQTAKCCRPAVSSSEDGERINRLLRFEVSPVHHRHHSARQSFPFAVELANEIYHRQNVKIQPWRGIGLDQSAPTREILARWTRTFVS